MTRGTRLVGLALAGAFALAACSETPTPIPTQSSSTPVPTSTTTSATPNPTPTEDPKVAAGKALVVKYFETYNASLRSLDTSAYRATFADSCARCLSSAAKIDGARKARQQVDGGGYEYDHFSVMQTNPLIVQVRVSQAAVTLRSSTGDVVKRFPGTAPSFVILHVRPISGALKITEIAG